MDEVIIKTEELTKTFTLGEVKVEAVRGISLEIKKGELLSIIGPSGSGKSTFMHLLGCLDSPTSGKYYLENEDVAKFSDNKLAKIRNKKVGFVFQNFNLLPHLTVLENVVLPAKYDQGSDLSEVEKKAIEILSRFGLEERLKNRPTQLSGGEMQRVAIARALINDPVILFADEPTGNLDSRTGLEIIKLFRDLNDENGVTEIIVTHDINITKFTRRTIRIKDGLIDSDDLNHHVKDLKEEGE